MAGRMPFGLGMLDRTHRRCPGVVELAREVQSPCESRERGDEDVVGVRFGELDRSAAGDHGSADVAVGQAGADQRRHCFDVRADTFRVLGVGPIREVEETALLERALPGHHRRGRRPDGEHRMLDELLVRQRAHRAEQRARSARSNQRKVAPDEELRDGFVVAGRCSVLCGLHRQALRPEPGGGAGMDRRRGPGLLGLELCPGELGEERVDTKPASVLEAVDEQGRALEPGQQRGGIGAPEHAVAELRREPAENRDVEEERAGVVVERREHLVGQVVDHEAMVAAEVAHRTRCVLGAAQPGTREHERGGPALGPFPEELDLVRPELDPAALDDELDESLPA